MQIVKIANYSYSGLERCLHLNSLMIMNSSRRGIILKFFFSVFQVIISLEGNKVFLVNFNFYLLYFAISE